MINMFFLYKIFLFHGFLIQSKAFLQTAASVAPHMYEPHFNLSILCEKVIIHCIHLSLINSKVQLSNVFKVLLFCLYPGWRPSEQLHRSPKVRRCFSRTRGHSAASQSASSALCSAVRVQHHQAKLQNQYKMGRLVKFKTNKKALVFICVYIKNIYLNYQFIWQLNYINYIIVVESLEICWTFLKRILHNIYRIRKYLLWAFETLLCTNFKYIKTQKSRVLANLVLIVYVRLDVCFTQSRT